MEAQVLDPQTLLFDFAESLETTIGTEKAAYALQKLTELAQLKPTLLQRIFDPEFLAELEDLQSENQSDNSFEVLLDPKKLRGIKRLISNYKGKSVGLFDLPQVMEDVANVFKQ